MNIFDRITHQANRELDQLQSETMANITGIEGRRAAHDEYLRWLGAAMQNVPFGSYANLGYSQFGSLNMFD